MVRARPGSSALIVIAVVCALARFVSQGSAFVAGSPRTRGRDVIALRGALSIEETKGSSPSSSSAAPAKKADGAAEKTGKKEDKEIDDAVLAMAAAMADEENEWGVRKPKPKDEGFKFELSNLITIFWCILIVYSFGSSFIAMTQGRMQDRTGGDFTAYDFFDNIFAFSEWDLEYSLGFDPFKLFGNK
mmetsp:Transcript_23709/g.55286  ORF Transcript_23709/g.55286 Transcript_23709/m.55286 type:complete len:188 (-) Transcript_23709:53-616(-)